MLGTAARSCPLASFTALSAVPRPRIVVKPLLASGASSPIFQARYFARDPKHGDEKPKVAIQEFRADKDRHRDAWAWVGAWEAKLERAKTKATKIRRKLHYPSECPKGRQARAAAITHFSKE